MTWCRGLSAVEDVGTVLWSRGGLHVVGQKCQLVVDALPAESVVVVVVVVVVEVGII